MCVEAQWFHNCVGEFYEPEQKIEEPPEALNFSGITLTTRRLSPPQLAGLISETIKWGTSQVGLKSTTLYLAHKAYRY